MLGPKQGVLGPQDSVMNGVQEEAPQEATPSQGGEAAPAQSGNEDFEGSMQSIQTLQAGVQGVLEGMIDMEAQTVNDPEGLARFLEGMAMLLAQFQGEGQAPAEPPMPTEG